MAREINFIRPQEVYDRNTGESKVRYRSYDGNDRFIPVVDGEKGVPKTMVEVTHAELKAMRDGGKLTAGALYRITDYNCTTTQENTQSAGHQFDIVLLALSESKLAEEGWAMMHENDTYFANSNLSAWKVWYCLDNDKSRFAWADPVNGKGVIYRMIDEHNNDCPYDFKNIQFKRWAVSGLTNAKLDQDTLDGLESDFVYDADDNPFCFAVESSNMILGSTTFVVNNEVSEWYYTFSLYDEEGHLNDYSLHVYKVYCEGSMAVAQSNSMLPAQDYDPNDEDEVYRYVLNNNVFLDKYDGENEWYTFCIGNEFKERSKNNTFGAYAQNNAFGAGATRNSFGAYAWNNSFGANAGYNTFGAGADSNSFGANAGYNTFGAGANNNSFGAGAASNSFGAGAASNSFGANAGYNNFGANARFNNFGANVASCVFAKDYTRYVVVESGNNNITLTSTQTTSQNSQLQNILIALGTNLSGSKTISHNTVGDTFKTTYQNANSDVVDV